MVDLALWFVFIGLVALFIWSVIYIDALVGVDLWESIYVEALRGVSPVYMYRPRDEEKEDDET